MVLAVSFSSYGLIKKIVPLSPPASMTAESAFLAVPALIFLGVLQARGSGTFTDHGAGHIVLLIVSGVVTVVPLLLFATATRALPLTVLGMIQYLTPVVQFLLGLFYAHEHMSGPRWIGFALVWIGLTVFSADSLFRARTNRREPGLRPDRPVASAQ